MVGFTHPVTVIESAPSAPGATPAPYIAPTPSRVHAQYRYKQARFLSSLIPPPADSSQYIWATPAARPRVRVPNRSESDACHICMRLKPLDPEEEEGASAGPEAGVGGQQGAGPASEGAADR